MKISTGKPEQFSAILRNESSRVLDNHLPHSRPQPAYGRPQANVQPPNFSPNKISNVINQTSISSCSKMVSFQKGRDSS